MEDFFNALGAYQPTGEGGQRRYRSSDQSEGTSEGAWATFFVFVALMALGLVLVGLSNKTNAYAEHTSLVEKPPTPEERKATKERGKLQMRIGGAIFGFSVGIAILLGILHYIKEDELS